jgi:hypothetical protein
MDVDAMSPRAARVSFVLLGSRSRGCVLLEIRRITTSILYYVYL